MEAMPHRVSVVATRKAASPDHLVNKRSELLPSPGILASRAHQLRGLFDSQCLHARLAKAAAAHVDAEFSQEMNPRRLLNFFGSVPASAG